MSKANVKRVAAALSEAGVKEYILTNVSPEQLKSANKDAKKIVNCLKKYSTASSQQGGRKTRKKRRSRRRRRQRGGDTSQLLTVIVCFVLFAQMFRVNEEARHSSSLPASLRVRQRPVSPTEILCKAAEKVILGFNCSVIKPSQKDKKRAAKVLNILRTKGGRRKSRSTRSKRRGRSRKQRGGWWESFIIPGLALIITMIAMIADRYDQEDPPPPWPPDWPAAWTPHTVASATPGEPARIRRRHEF